MLGFLVVFGGLSFICYCGGYLGCFLGFPSRYNTNKSEDLIKGAYQMIGVR